MCGGTGRWAQAHLKCGSISPLCGAVIGDNQSSMRDSDVFCWTVPRNVGRLASMKQSVSDKQILVIISMQISHVYTSIMTDYYSLIYSTLYCMSLSQDEMIPIHLTGQRPWSNNFPGFAPPVFMSSYAHTPIMLANIVRIY